jgi:hypothetical protein
LGGAQEPINAASPTDSPISTGHTDTPSWNVTPLIMIVLPVAVVELAAHNAYWPEHLSKGSAWTGITVQANAKSKKGFMGTPS